MEATPHFAAVDAALSDMNGAEHAHLWTVEALRDAPEWARVRELAARALHFLQRPLIGQVHPEESVYGDSR